MARKTTSMKKSRVIFLIVAFVLLAGILYVYREYNRPNKILSEIDPAEKISAPDLLASFTSNDSLANLKFLGKIVEIDGILKNVETPEDHISIFVLGGKEAMSSVRCTMDSSFNRQSFSMEKGSPVIIKGICTGYNADELLGSDVLLNRCVIVSGK